MRSAVRRTGQACHIALWDSGDIVVDSPIVTPGLWRWSLRAGAHLGLYNSGSGQTLAAFQTLETQKQMIAEHRLVEGEEQIDEGVFLTRLAKVREDGFFLGAKRDN